MPKVYKVKEKVSDDIIEQLLHNRGIQTDEERHNFLNPDFDKHLYDPFLLPDMEKAVDRILYAIKSDEKIGIWSDYDADGIPGGALLHDFFKKIGFNNFVNYIPDRHEEGYGLNSEGVEELSEQGVKLLITIDCGIRDAEEVQHARAKGMEVIITDHHEPDNSLPDAFAAVDHKRKDSLYPEQVLCGSGVIWKLIQAILHKRRAFMKDGQEKWLLDLAGLATLSDMVPLTGENRAIAHFGLSVLRKTRRPGLRKLYSMLRINPTQITEDDIGFLITPRINAASRMGRPMDAFDLLTANDDARAEVIARHLDKINNERKGVVAAMVKEAKHTITHRVLNEGEKSVIVLGNPLWRPSLLGLAANSIAEEYGRPVFLWGRSGESIKGSCRSDGETDLVALMERVGNTFLEFGGHKLSGGFSIAQEKVHTLEQALVDASTHVFKESNHVDIDANLTLRDVCFESVQHIYTLAPFGMGNDKPTFVFPDVIPEKIHRFGKGNDHLSVQIRDGAKTMKAISFFTSPDQFGEALSEGKTTNLVANLELSYWNSTIPEVRLRIVDFF